VGLCDDTSIEANFGSQMFNYPHPIFETLQKEQSLTTSFASERYLTHITTDKPIYRPGDTVYFRGWILHAHKNTILENAKAFFSVAQSIKLKIVSPGDEDKHEEYFDLPVDSTIASSWKIPSDLAGGDYKLIIEYFNVEGFPPAERKFNIREFSNRMIFLTLVLTFFSSNEITIRFPQKRVRPRGRSPCSPYC
jgi:hypothetical protein